MPNEQQPSPREALELQKIRQDLRYGTISLYLSIIGSGVLLTGVAFDRVKATAKVKFHQALMKYLAEKPSERPNEYFSALAMQITFACKTKIDPREVEKQRAIP